MRSACGDGAVELDQDLPALTLIAVPHMDGRDDAGFQRLNGLGAAGRHDLARRGRDNVDMAEDRPADRDDEEQDDRRADRAADRRGRRLQDFQRGRQELEFAPVARCVPRCTGITLPLATLQLTTWRPAWI